LIVPECASNIIDIVIVLDSSESVGDKNWRKMEVFVESMINSSKIPDVRFVKERFYFYSSY
jgi:hypothetical protein